MKSVMVGHVISVNWDLGRGMKAIIDTVCSKLGVREIVISQIREVSSIQEEMKDFDTLYSNSLLEKSLKYNFNDCWLDSEKLVDSLCTQLFTNSEEALKKEVTINGMDSDSYIKMVTECSDIRKKYVS